ncbi:MAG: AAA family ATPase [Candidatus Saccharimonadales bacterium]
MTSKIIPQKPFLIMFYGYPGCGKSFFASRFAGEFQNTAYLPTYKTVSEISKIASGNQQLASKVTDFIAENYLQNGISVFTDASVTKKIDRKKLNHLALKYNAVPILIWMQIDADSAYMRTKLRAKKSKNEDSAAKYTKEEYQNIVNNMQNPHQNEDFFVISGKHTYKTQRALVMSKMSVLKIINRSEANKNIAKPGLVNLVPTSLSGRGGFGRNISIR